MSIKAIRKRLTEVGVKAKVEFLHVPKECRNEYTAYYKIVFPSINGEEYYNKVMDKYDAYCRIEDYVKLRGNNKN